MVVVAGRRGWSWASWGVGAIVGGRGGRGGPERRGARRRSGRSRASGRSPAVGAVVSVGALAGGRGHSRSLGPAHRHRRAPRPRSCAVKPPRAASGHNRFRPAADCAGRPDMAAFEHNLVTPLNDCALVPALGRPGALTLRIDQACRRRGRRRLGSRRISAPVPHHNRARWRPPTGRLHRAEALDEPSAATGVARRRPNRWVAICDDAYEPSPRGRCRAPCHVESDACCA